MRFLTLALLLCLPAASRADFIITFGTAPRGEIPLNTSWTDGAFTLTVLSGQLFGDVINLSGAGEGGVLGVSRTDGQPFTFVSADVTQFHTEMLPVKVGGFLDGNLVGSDILPTTIHKGEILNDPAVNLLGVSINQLQVTLDTTSIGTVAIANLRLGDAPTGVATPAPATLLLAGLGLPMLAMVRRRRK